MLFTSAAFVAFLSGALVLYYLPGLRTAQVHVLLLASLVFCSADRLEYVALLMVTISMNAGFSYRIAHGPDSQRQLALALGIASNLLVLASFKYAPGLPLPIGISFYCFHGIALIVDAYREAVSGGRSAIVAPDWFRHLRQTALYISFFPHFVAGPILRAHEFLPQLTLKRWSEVPWDSCFRELVIGCFLKMVVADNLHDLTSAIDAPYFESQSSLTLAAMIFGYSVQIFSDFAGYSLIACGLARLFGYQLPRNFDFPYLAPSITAFWQRWHISLSNWFRDYVFLPLSVLLGRWPAFRDAPVLNGATCAVVTMLACGLWHGDSLPFLIWGLAHGVASAVHQLWRQRVVGALSAGRRRRLMASPTYRVASTLLTFGFVSLAWLLFRLPRLDQAVRYLHCLRDNGALETDHARVFEILVFCSPVVAYHLYDALRRRIALELPTPVMACILGTLLALIVLERGTPGPFLYFQF